MQNTVRKPRPELGKWSLWRFFAAVPAIRKYLPSTSILTLASLNKYLNHYGSVYVKPSAGWGGRGITKVWKRPGNVGYAYVIERGIPVYCKTVNEVYTKLRAKHRKDIIYIVQQAIQLAKINGRPFDIRVMMMRVYGKWECAGMLAKVAGPGSVITNLARGKGYVTDIDSALQQSMQLTEQQRTKLKNEMIRLGHLTAKRFEDWNRYSQIGLDLAVDAKGRLWIIEENTGPAHSLFAKLKDQTAYRRIRQIVAIWQKSKAAGTKAQQGKSAS